ncbi:hypothetical protein KRX51_07495 [Corynebacterium sp. TAE3-ERU12]|nr:hypothetical protein [Corynebacterium sp. TAE3-ERU12]MBV7295757.1 hypothetical protein [Corynebacterium sp. TAE3-ERU12]
MQHTTAAQHTTTGTQRDEFSLADYFGLFIYEGPETPGILHSDLVTVAA